MSDQRYHMDRWEMISGDRDTISGEGRGCEPCGEEKYAGSG